MMARNCLPILDLTFLLKGGLNQVTFLFLFFVLVGVFLAFGSNFNLCLYSLASRAAWYGGMAVIKISSLAEILESLFSIFLGRFLRIEGGWLLLLCT